MELGYHPHRTSSSAIGHLNFIFLQTEQIPANIIQEALLLSLILPLNLLLPHIANNYNAFYPLC